MQLSRVVCFRHCFAQLKGKIVLNAAFASYCTLFGISGAVFENVRSAKCVVAKGWSDML